MEISKLPISEGAMLACDECSDAIKDTFYENQSGMSLGRAPGWHLVYTSINRHSLAAWAYGVKLIHSI